MADDQALTRPALALTDAGLLRPDAYIGGEWRRGSAGSATALHFLMPPVGLVMGWAVLGEPLGAIDLLAIVPIALGIRLATRVETGQGR